jgi:hypothetical protein
MHYDMIFIFLLLTTLTKNSSSKNLNRTSCFLARFFQVEILLKVKFIIFKSPNNIKYFKSYKSNI